MDCTIIIPAYNQGQYLKDAIDSALNQTVKCNVIVVDDGSTDNTLYIAQNCPVTVVSKENNGLSSARNTGIKLANTEWVLTLDSDDKIAPDFVEKCLNKANKENLDIVGTWQQEFGDSNNQFNFLPYPTHEMFLTSNRINCCSLFRKKMWEEIGGYDENMRLGYEDYDLWLRSTKKCYTVGIVPEYLFFYRKHGESLVTVATRHHDEIRKYMQDKYESS